MVRPILALILVLIGLQIFGGTAIWHAIGLGGDLDINGTAPKVADVPDGIGDGWTAYGGDKSGNRYTRATQITPENVADLRIAWTHRSGAFENKPQSDIDRSAFQSTPILVEGSLVYCTQFNEVIALDPGTGEEKWRYDPDVPTGNRPGNQYTCRGVSYWKGDAENDQGNCAARIFMGTVDSRLIALDAQTGAPCRDFGDDGAVMLKPSVDLRWPGEFQITSAPAVIGDIIITGSSISDNLRTDAPKGTVHAFDARSGALRWTFNPVPQSADDSVSAEWTSESAQRTGHANVWSTISVDEARGLVFLPTSSPSPDYYGGNRIGDNRYANSVVALDGETGAVVWSFQTVHHDVWDFDVPAQPGLYQVWQDGKRHDVVAQITKAGLVFVLDRDTGKPFLPIEERTVSQGGVEGDVLSKTQPFPINTPPVVPSSFDPSKAFGVTIWDKMACANTVKNLRSEGLYTPPSVEGTLAYPFTGGGGNWGSAAFDPSRNLLVVNMSNIAAYVRLTKKTSEGEPLESIIDGAETAPMEGAPYVMERAALLSPLGLPCSPPPWGVLAGIDLSNGEIVWRRTHGTTRDLAPGGVSLKLGTPTIGGPAVTASGLIFIGAAFDDYLRAFDTETGDELWKGRLPAGGQATPMSYEYEGRQFVVIAAGGHARAGTKLGDHLVAFSLPEK